MPKDILTDADVEREIERLQESDAVKLAMKEKQYKYKRRQYMYTLRWYEKRGKQLQAQGMSLDDYDFAEAEDDNE